MFNNLFKAKNAMCRSLTEGSQGTLLSMDSTRLFSSVQVENEPLYEHFCNFDYIVINPRPFLLFVSSRLVVLLMYRAKIK